MAVEIKRKDKDALKKVYERLGALGKREVAVGYPAGKASAYPDGTAVAQVAAWNVFGTPRIPKRDFFALAKDDIKKEALEIMKLVAVAQTEEKQEVLMNLAGEAATSALKQAITDLDSPPNAPSTIARKGSSNPLIDTAHMRDSTTYVVRDKT